MSAAPPKLVVAVIGYTGGVGTCLLKAMQKIQLQPFALVRSSTMKINDAAESPTDYQALSEQLLEQAKLTRSPRLLDQDDLDEPAEFGQCRVCRR